MKGPRWQWIIGMLACAAIPCSSGLRAEQPGRAGRTEKNADKSFWGNETDPGPEASYIIRPAIGQGRMRVTATLRGLPAGHRSGLLEGALIFR